ncbi:MAG: MFS transporter [Alicyclobacillaceae bacterium]|nr:MFS transporter [Alicyclobacillaceae bacterium]
MNRNLWLLAVCQGLFSTNNVSFIAINGLVGLALAPNSWMATIPVAAYVVGGALSTGPVAATQRRMGRKRSFQIGIGVAVVSALACALAVVLRSFWLVALATLVAGFYNANANLYRFAAAEVSRPEWRDKAVSLVTAGGLLGGILGPNLSAQTRTWLGTPYVGTYLALAGVAVVSLIAVSFTTFPPKPAKPSAQKGRSMLQMVRQPVFIVAALTGALSYGVMNLLMAATPMAMAIYKLPFADTAIVLECHVIGMFAPGFFTGHLIKRFGPLPVMAAGVVLNGACIAVGLSGVTFHHFLLGLFLLGVGWNFLFTGSTTLSLEAYQAEERDRAQGVLNFFTFAMLAATSLSSGALVTTKGWSLLNGLSAVLVAIAAAAIFWLWAIRRKPASRQPDWGTQVSSEP